jgi:hypothetical protein
VASVSELLHRKIDKTAIHHGRWNLASGVHKFHIVRFRIIISLAMIELNFDKVGDL